MHVIWANSNVGLMGGIISKPLRKALNNAVVEYINNTENKSWDEVYSWFITEVVIEEVAKWDYMGPNEYGVLFKYTVVHNEGSDNKWRFKLFNVPDLPVTPMAGRRNRRKKGKSSKYIN